MGDRISLYLLSLFYPLFGKMGVNSEHIHEITRTKLWIDARRPAFMMQKAKTTGQGSTGMVILTLVMGTFYAAVLFAFKDALLGMTAYFSIFMVMISLTLVADFSSVLFDTRDQFVISPRPVDDKTYAVSRIVHICIYVLKLATVQALPAVVFVAIIHGILAVPVFIVQVFEATLLCVIFVNMLYLALMKSVDQQKFKDVIAWFQAGMSVAVFSSYYLLPQFFNSSRAAGFKILDHPWCFVLPPVWVASVHTLIFHLQQGSFKVFLLAFTGITAAFGGLWLLINVLAPGFNRRLSLIGSSEGLASSGANRRNSTLTTWISEFGNRITNDSVERAGFLITWKLMLRSREFMMKILPQFVFVPVIFVFYMVKDMGQGLSKSLALLNENHHAVYLFYFTSMALSGMLQHVSFSDKYKAAWIYYVSPVAFPGKIQGGMFKAVISILFIPFFLVITLVAVTIWGPGILKDASLALFVCLISGLVSSIFSLKGFPFSKPVLVNSSGGKVFIALLTIGFIMAFAYGHSLIAGYNLLVWAIAAIMAGIYLVLMQQYKKQSWADIESSDIY